jgi:hypothetical protein
MPNQSQILYGELAGQQVVGRCAGWYVRWHSCLKDGVSMSKLTRYLRGSGLVALGRSGLITVGGLAQAAVGEVSAFARWWAPPPMRCFWRMRNGRHRIWSMFALVLSAVIPACSSPEASDAPSTTVSADMGSVTASTKAVSAATQVPLDKVGPPETAPKSRPDPEAPVSGAAGISIGELHNGLSAQAVVELLGPPDDRTEPTMQEATGDIVSDWTWSAAGVAITFVVAEFGGQSVNAITVTAPSALHTAEGIGIGSRRPEVEASYRGRIALTESDDASIVVGSTYDGLILGFTDGAVSRIFIGAAAE